MPTLRIELRFEIPMLGTWRWTPADYEAPLVFQFSDCRAELRLVSLWAAMQGQRHITWQGLLSFVYTSPSSHLIAAVGSNGDPSRKLAESLFEKYLAVFRQFEELLRTKARIRDLGLAEPSSLEALFRDDGDIADEGATWRLDDGPAKPFSPRLRAGRKGKRIRPLFKKGQLVTAGMWRELQQCIDEGIEHAPELMELLRAQSELRNASPKVPTIEAAVFMESLLRTYVESVLQSLGFSKTQIKDLRRELTFNVLLNLVLPLTLTRSQVRKCSKSIGAVNALRKIRNDLAHGEITESEVDVKAASRGIDGAMVLLGAIKKRRTQLQLT